MVSLALRKDRNNQLDASLVRPQNRNVKKSSFYWNYFLVNNIVYSSARYFGSERPINFFRRRRCVTHSWSTPSTSWK